MVLNEKLDVPYEDFKGFKKERVEHPGLEHMRP
jgi:hypothetical protein